MAILKKKVEGYRDAKLIVVEEQSCPIYNVGEEFRVENFRLSISSNKAGCLQLARQIASVVSSRNSSQGFAKLGSRKYRFDCGGCIEGRIYFDYVKEKKITTLQMKLLSQMENHKRETHLNKYVRVMRLFKIFDSLDDDTLKELTQLMDFGAIPGGRVIARKGTPGTHLYIILQGQVEIKADDGANLAELGAGEIFGEGCLLMAEPLRNSFFAATNVRLAMISVKNFKHILEKYPVIQIFIFKMLIEQAQSKTFLPSNINSGMTGALDEIPLVEVFQLINSTQKTGRIDLALDNGKAKVFFSEGEIISAAYRDLYDKEAVYALLRIKSGHFTYTQGIPEELEKLAPLGNFMAMILEGVKSLDESK